MKSSKSPTMPSFIVFHSSFIFKDQRVLKPSPDRQVLQSNLPGERIFLFKMPWTHFYIVFFHYINLPAIFSREKAHLRYAAVANFKFSHMHMVYPLLPAAPRRRLP